MNYLPLIGRILFAAIFIAASFRHFTAEGISHARDLGTPFASFFVPLSGVMAFAGGLSILLGFHARWGAGFIILFLLPVTFLMHAFWNAPDATMRHIQLAMFMKNLCMLGGAVFILHAGAGAFSFDAMRGAR